MTISFFINMGFGGFFFLLLGLLYFVLWIYCLVDVLRSDFKDPNMKLIWTVILLFAQVVGPLAYLAIGKSTKISAI